MAIGRTTVRLALIAALLVSAGCASRGGRFPLARVLPGSKPSRNVSRSDQAASRSDEVLPKYNRNQLLAAARQYEKEGRVDQATVYYRQVLALDPQDAEAREGLQMVQSGQRREKTSIDDLIAASRPAGSPLPRPTQPPSDAIAEIDEQMALLIAEAAATATVVKSNEPATPIMAVSASKSDADVTETQLAVYDWGTTRPAQPQTLTAEQATAATLEPQPVAAASQNVSTEPTVTPPIAQAEVSLQVVEATSYENPTDWTDDSKWQPHTVTKLCTDANAAVLREVAKLDSEDAAIRKDGLWALAEMGTDAKSAAEAVRILLQDEQEIVRAHAAWATWELTGDAMTSVEALTSLLSSSDTEVVQFAAFTLAGVGRPAQVAVPALRHQLQHTDGLVRLHVAEAIAKVGTDADKVTATRTLISLTTQSETQIRMLSLVALGETTQSPTPELATAITQALHDSDAEVRSAAALTLGSFGKAAESAITQLEFVAKTDEQDVRLAAETAIACIRK